eukprot:CAMPEP_0172319516 /NCGR_PEP_ID=MMETSP1058-20130122/37866_1 /TAXON_ID=83371 /ORGANISM="Detonula confervacea, Strain CCMP 353" /LENGTH=57 /DNA_ID=CAMNT_0013034575 /DNA_START=73 /DNA_END=243 /DNA_ORIENTATION=-
MASATAQQSSAPSSHMTACQRQCDNNPGNGTCTRVQRFSNPNFLYNDKPIGTATIDN